MLQLEDVLLDIAIAFGFWIAAIFVLAVVSLALGIAGGAAGCALTATPE